MRSIVFFALLCLVPFTSCRATSRWGKKPATLEEAYMALNSLYDDTAVYSFMTLPEDVATIRLHMSLGMWIRNRWGLWRNSRLSRYFQGIGIFHPDDMSGIILTSWHRYLNNKPVDLDQQVSKYKEHWRQLNDTAHGSGPLHYSYTGTSRSSLLKIFPVGDTIFLGVYAVGHKAFRTVSSSLSATAVVREHHSNSLLIEVVWVEQDGRKTTQTKPGDIFEADPWSCSPLPPPGWHRP